jgi:hypothetical protein
MADVPLRSRGLTGLLTSAELGTFAQNCNFPQVAHSGFVTWQRRFEFVSKVFRNSRRISIDAIPSASSRLKFKEA